MPRRARFFIQPCECGGTCGGCDEETVTAAIEGTTAAVGDPPADGPLPERWHAVVLLEGLRTGDHRAIRPMALEFRDLPLPLWAQARNSSHFDAPLVGSIETLERVEWDAVPGVQLIMGTGTFDLGGTEGQEAARLVRDQVLRWGSADIDVFASEVMGTPPWAEDGLDIILGGADVEDWWEEITSGRVAGFTLHPHPAFQQCVVAPDSVELEIPAPIETEGATLPGLIAASTPAEPPSGWFADPSLDAPTPLRVGDDGRVWGHIATWRTCHTGLLRSGCTRPPRSSLNYEPFHSGGFVQTDSGAVRVGHLTMDGGHAELPFDARRTRRHYDDSTTVWANVRAGEDALGIWVAGAVAPGITTEQIMRARSLAVSGDWRAWPGAGLELIAALSVPVPGFPVSMAAGAEQMVEVRPRARLVDDEPMALVAAGMLAPARHEGLTAAAVQAIVDRSVADLRASLLVLDPLVTASLVAEMDTLVAASP